MAANLLQGTINVMLADGAINARKLAFPKVASSNNEKIAILCCSIYKCVAIQYIIYTYLKLNDE